jgi:hypothetical protein
MGVPTWCSGRASSVVPDRVHLFFHYMANKFLTFVSNVFTNLNLTDMETCYKVMRREVVARLNLKTNRFGVEPEITPRWPGCGPGSTRFRFPTADAISAKARRSVGRMGSRRFGPSSSSTFGTPRCEPLPRPKS